MTLRRRSAVAAVLAGIVLGPGLVRQPGGARAETPAAAAAAGAGGVERDVQVLRGRIREQLVRANPWQGSAAVAGAAEALRTMRPDGSWADQDYADTNREAWRCQDHLPRVLAMARAAAQPGATDADRRRYNAAAVTALDYWFKVDPHNTNWWHNEIGVPLDVGNILILLGDAAPPATRAAGIKLMRRSNWAKWTGQNLVWGVGIQVVRGCLDDAPRDVAAAFARMWEEIKIVPGLRDGIQPDFSFHQHGPLIYAGGYGAGFTSDTTRFLSQARDTSFAIPADKLKILEGLVLDGQQWMVRGPVWDYSVVGRELVRPGKDANGLAAAVERLADVPGPRQAELAQFAARQRGDATAPPLVGNRHFWCSDYTAHSRAGYFTSARACSARTLNTDGYINGENKQSHHLADGATYVYLTGLEYRDIFPVWDWHRVPGTTVEQNTPMVPKAVNHKGTTTFVGGVSDGTYGCATMDLRSDALTAKKSWFYFDDEFACLGADVACPTDNPVLTSLNQCLLNGPVKTSAHSDDLPRGDHALTGIRWVWHDSVGYVFPRPADVHVRNDAQTGSWHAIGPRSDATISTDVFSAWVDHGSRVSGGWYAYTVVPAADVAKTAAEATDPPVEILSNTPDLQAVRHKKLDLLEAVFRRPTSVTSDALTVGVDQPCALLVRRQGDKLRLAVANPDHQPASIAVTVSLNLQGDAVTHPRPGASTVRIDLPGGDDAGRSVVEEFEVR